MKQGKRKMATMAIVATLLATGATAQTYTHHYPKAVERAAAKWVKQGQWRGAFNKAVPAPTVNLTEFCIQYSRNPKLWDELFQWLQNNDLKALKPGRTPIGKTGLVASVEDGTNWCSEHDLRNGKGSESHRDNIDFMIVVDGVEGLALIDHDTATPLADYTPDVEQYSIDEAFLDMTGTEALFGPPLTVAHTIRNRVREELGFTVNIGVAPNRLLAKMASDFEKPDKVHTLFPAEVPEKMWPLPVGSLFGVGPSAVKRLNQCGMYTIGDLARAERKVIVGLFGTRGDTLWNYANGREADPVTKQTTRDNTYGNSVTLPEDLAKPEQADATLLALCDSVGRRLRTDGKTARVVTVQLVDNAFRRTSHQTTLPDPTNSTDRLYEVALQLMRQMWPARPVRLVGVSAEKTGTDNFEQLDLFTDTTRRQKQEKLDRTADALRRKFGGAAVTRAKLLTPETRAPAALYAAKERDKQKKK